MFFVRHRTILYIITLGYLAICIGSIFYFGWRPGIEFTGGTIVEVSYPEKVASKEEIESRLDTLNLGAYSLRPTGETGYLLRSKDLSPELHDRVLNAFSHDGAYQIVEERRNTIGPTIGMELRNKAFVAIAVVSLLIIIYVAIAFAKVSEPVSSWAYGLIAILTLLHDITVPTGIFAIMGYFTGAEIDVLFVTALLTILGYSVNDTIVVFDRVRENLKLNAEQKKEEPFEYVVGRSLEETLTRSINTSVTVLLVVLALLFLGAESTRNFALVLTAGIVAGAYSSVALAAPLLVTVEKWLSSREKEV